MVAAFALEYLVTQRQYDPAGAGRLIAVAGLAGALARLTAGKWSDVVGSRLAPMRRLAYVNAVAHPDIEVARSLVRGRLGVYARFSTMSRSVLDTLSSDDRRVAEDLVASYDLHAHAASGARHEAALANDFVDRFGIVGPSEQVAERLTNLVRLGLDHLVIVGHSRNAAPDVFAESSRRFGDEVLPAVREHAVP